MRCYPDLESIPADIHIDIVNIFRHSSHTAEMVEEVIKRSEKTTEKPVVWTQLDVSSEQAKMLAESAGLAYVKNRCIMVVHSQLASY